MRVLLVIPSSHSLPPAVTDKFGRNIVVLQIPKDYGKTSGLELSDPLSTTIVILSDPTALDDNQIVTLIEEGIATVAAGLAVAFVPGTGIKPVLATAAAAYAFSGHSVHLAGGLDSNLTIDALGLDTQFRLAGRAVETVAIGSSAITSTSKVPVATYLTVLSKNVTSQVQAGYLAPLFAGIVHHSLTKTGTDTSLLDLQRSPGGDDKSLMPFPPGAFEGAEILRKWAGNLTEIEGQKTVTSEARRIPDRQLPHLDKFIDEIWQASGIGTEQRSILETAFSDVVRSGRPQITFGVRASNQAALNRMDAITAQINKPLYWWDPQSQLLRERPLGATEWQLSDTSMDTAGSDTDITYLIGIHAREVPWRPATRSILISDFSTSDVISEIRSESVGNSAQSSFLAPEATLFIETVRQSDALIAKSVAQRDFLLGAIAGLYRLNQFTYDEDPSLNSLILVEDGTKAALDAISRPVHPFERVRTTSETDRSRSSKSTKSSFSPKDVIRDAGSRASKKLRGVRK